MIDCSVCIVNYNSSAVLSRLLATIPAAAAGIDAEILVVDNASSDDFDNVVRTLPPSSVLRNPENCFFTAADNQNLARARGRHIVSVNPDIEFHPGALAALSAYLDAHPDVGAVAPRFLYPDGRTQPSLGRFPTRAFGLMEAAGVNDAFPENRINRAIMTAAITYDPESEADADVLYGACIMTRREVLAGVGLKDESFVHGWDEYDWCRRMRDAGWRLVYVPSAVCMHHRGYSRASSPLAHELYLHHWRGMVRLYRKHYGAMTALALRVLRHAVAPLLRGLFRRGS